MISRQRERFGILCGIAMCASLLVLYGFKSTGEAGVSDGKVKQSAKLVARNDYDIGKNWQPRQIMGRDFWHILGVSCDSQPDEGSWARTRYRELRDKPLFKESGLDYKASSVYIRIPGAESKITMSDIKNMNHNEYMKHINSFDKVSISGMEKWGYLKLIDSRPNAPFFIASDSNDRPLYRLIKRFEHDTEGYETWKQKHPNFKGSINMETDNDFLATAPWMHYLWPEKKKAYDKKLVQTIEKEFPKPQNREELTAQYMKTLELYPKFFFNDSDKTGFMRAAHCHDHYYCESGAGMILLETTNTALPNGSLNYRHRTSLFFTRGAARQYNKNWGWYIAVYYNGYDDKGRFSGNNVPDYHRVDKPVEIQSGTYKKNAVSYEGPGCGMSPSLVTRTMFLAYLSGASFVEHEGCWNYLSVTQKDGQETYGLDSPFGKAWEDWFEFTRKNPNRGASYAPVALLVPFEQGYPNYGGKSWQIFNYERPDWMIDAFMFTIMPHAPVTQNGDEGAMANSPHGDIYDVIVPNAPSGTVSIDVLKCYKVTVMLGKYPNSKALAERLMEYVKAGGTLLINIKQVNEFFPASFLGFERTNVPGTMEVKGPVRATTGGQTFALTEGYECELIKLDAALPLLEDASGNILACKNIFGKGHVIVSTVDFLVPRNYMNDQGDVLGKMVYGKAFPFVEYFLSNVEKEVLPLEVRGDIHYGMNKLDDGWLLYLINNKGVTKFTNKEQTLDMSKTAKVEVYLRDIKSSAITELRGQQALQKDVGKNSFTVNVPPGDLKIFKITNDIEKEK